MKGHVHERTNAKGKKVFCLVYWVGQGDKKRRKWATLPHGTTSRQARDILNERLTDVKRRRYVDADITFADLSARWLDAMTAKVENNERKSSTLDGYRSIADIHLIPFFRDMIVKDITVSDVEDYIDAKRGTIGNKSIGYTIGQLSRMLKKACAWGMAYQNVAAFAERPTPEHKEVKILSSDEIDRLLSVADGQDKLITLTGILTGMRAGEICALSWGRVDLIHGVIDISGPRGNYVRGQFCQPKAKGSIRQIPIAPLLVDELARIKPEDAKDDDLLFTNNSGQPIEWTNFLHRSWQPLLDAAAVPRVKFHSLRHNFVSVLRAAGYDWPMIQRLTGHRDLSTTQDIYTHALPGQEVGAGQKIQDAFSDYVK